MTLIEAIESGKNFTSPRWNDWCSKEEAFGAGPGYFGVKDRVANDFFTDDQLPKEGHVVQLMSDDWRIFQNGSYREMTVNEQIEWSR